jgi:hypothetical protein
MNSHCTLKPPYTWLPETSGINIGGSIWKRQFQIAQSSSHSTRFGNRGMLWACTEEVGIINASYLEFNELLTSMMQERRGELRKRRVQQQCYYFIDFYLVHHHRRRKLGVWDFHSREWVWTFYHRKPTEPVNIMS